MSPSNLPFHPTRSGLYDPAELFEGFDPASSAGYTASRDFSIYRYFVQSGRTAPTDPHISMMEALHDNAINQALLSFLRGRRVAAIMGGHKERRDGANYAAVARLSRLLSQRGFLMASGGGPGAMEATHLGALLQHEPDHALDEARAILDEAPTMPAAADLVASSGDVNTAVAEALHRWFAPAWKVARQVRAPGESLAVPTWHYGHEPTSPLATHIAKYFQNSIREDGLLAIATHGIVFSPGKAGTLQEVFQDACQNFYHSFGGCFSPMVFFGVAYWRDTLPVRPLLDALFRLDAARAAEFERQVLFSDDVDEIVEFLAARTPTKAQEAEHWDALGCGSQTSS